MARRVQVVGLGPRVAAGVRHRVVAERHPVLGVGELRLLRVEPDDLGGQEGQLDLVVRARRQHRRVDERGARSRELPEAALRARQPQHRARRQRRIVEPARLCRRRRRVVARVGALDRVELGARPRQQASRHLELGLRRLRRLLRPRQRRHVRARRHRRQRVHRLRRLVAELAVVREDARQLLRLAPPPVETLHAQIEQRLRLLAAHVRRLAGVGVAAHPARRVVVERGEHARRPIARPRLVAAERRRHRRASRPHPTRRPACRRRRDTCARGRRDSAPRPRRRPSRTRPPRRRAPPSARPAPCAAPAPARASSASIDGKRSSAASTARARAPAAPAPARPCAAAAQRACLVDDGALQLAERLAGERPLAVERLVQRHAEAELIGARVGRLAAHLLGRHVRRRAHHRARAASARRRRCASGDDGLGSIAGGLATARARPKSVTRTRPSPPIRTLSGLKSRCTRPAACAAASPRPAATKTRRISRPSASAPPATRSASRRRRTPWRRTPARRRCRRRTR